MSSFFNAVFACCLRAHSPSPERPDETTHLIPAAQDVDIPPQRPHVVVVDPQKMKERLGTIVRSKEGKMVNVHSPAPFNVQNRAALPNGQSSTSRSTRYPSPQPSLQTSRSTTSLQHDAAAVVGAEDDGSGSAALNVRLVKTAGAVRRGRPGSRSRLGRFGEERRAENELGGEVENGNGNENAGQGEEAGGPASGEEGDNADIPAPPQPKPTRSIRRGFKIQSTSALARSWGD